MPLAPSAHLSPAIQHDVFRPTLRQGILARLLIVSPMAKQGAVPSSWSVLSLSYVDLRNNLGICGGMPSWESSVTVHLANTNSHQSCLLVHASGVVVGMVFGELSL